MITSRFLGDRALDHFGPRKTVLYGGYLGGIGLGAGIAIGVPLSDTQPILALIIVNIGFACAGIGIGPMFPAYILAASEVPGIASSVAIARVGVIGIAGYFIGRPCSIDFASSCNDVSGAHAFTCWVSITCHEEIIQVWTKVKAEIIKSR